MLISDEEIVIISASLLIVGKEARATRKSQWGISISLKKVLLRGSDFLSALNNEGVGCRMVKWAFC